MNNLLKLYLKQEFNTKYLEWFNTNEISIKKMIKELYAQNMDQIDEESNKIAEETYNEEKLDLMQKLNSIKIDINNREQKFDLNRNKEL